jgi:hypothetical protein
LHFQIVSFSNFQIIFFILFLLLSILLLLLILLLMPVHLRIYPDGEGIEKNKRSFLRLSFDLDGEYHISLLLNVFYLRFRWYPLHNENNKPGKNKASKKISKAQKLNWNRMKFLIQIAWQSINKSKLKKLYLDLDTSNVIINANLYPVFELINERPRVNLNINYSGNFALSLDLQNNLWVIVRIVIRNLLKRSFIFTKK